MKKLFVSTLAVLALFCNTALAEPPPGSDPTSPLAAYARSIRHRSGRSCCSEADCRPTTVLPFSDGMYHAWISKEQYGEDAPDDWVEIPWSVIEDTIANGPPPDGHSWVCYSGRVLCAILLTQS